MTSKKITIIANSVALRVRPQDHINDTYSDRLNRELNYDNSQPWQIVNQGKSRLIVTEISKEIENYIDPETNIFILNVGCVDAPNREIPLWFSDILFKRKYVFAYPLVSSLYRYIIKPYLRRPLVYLRGKRPWVSLTVFESTVTSIISYIKAHTTAQIIVLGINPGNARIESELPGTIDNYKIYDRVLEQISRQYELTYIDTKDLNSEQCYPDGVHFNSKGHAEICKRILDVIGAINE